MKKLVILIILCGLLSSCSIISSHDLLWADDGAVADETIQKLMEAVKAKDAGLIQKQFADSVQSGIENLDEQALALIDYIEGEIQSYSSANERGVGANLHSEYGKRQKEILPVFTIYTSENVYYVAFKECVRDEFDRENVGLHSLYIIAKEDWDDAYTYRGDGKWTPGIHIAKKKGAERYAPRRFLSQEHRRNIDKKTGNWYDENGL